MLEVAIVSGICLPILLLLGVNNGQIAQLTASLTKSSTGREINFSTVRNNLLRLSDVAELQNSIPNIDILVPEGRCNVNLVKDGKSVENVAIRSTISGDPRLGDYGISIGDYGTEGKPEVILSPTLAEELNVTECDTIKLQVSRRENYNDIAETNVTVSHIFPEALLDDKDNKTASAVGYAAVEFVLDLRRYESGQQVKRFGWAASQPPPEEKYGSFLIFTRKEDDVTKNDFEQRAEDIGMEIQEVADKNLQTLYGTLNEKAAEDLRVFRIFYSGTEKDNYGEMKQERVIPLIDRVTAAIVPWNTPQKMKLNGKDECFVVGVTLPNIVWLKKYVQRKEFFTDKDNVYQVILPLSPSTIETDKSVTIESQKTSITLTAKRATTSNDNTEEKSLTPTPIVREENKTVFVPARLLAYCYAGQNGNAVYETLKKIFIQKPIEPEITDFRCYAKTIYNVGEAIDYLRQEKHYGVQDGNRQQIDELSKRINELWLAVAVIGMTVFVFGLITVFCVLLDSTDRKRGTIGILRVMGVSKFGAFYIIFLRSMNIGVISVFVTISLGFGLQLLLSYEWDLQLIRLPSAYIVFRWFDILILSVGELIVCFVGTLPPAYKASKLDPFDAIYN
jgi:ABC-type lipoprotein release transport system permease subunit